jgi:hypothetical protein
MPCEFYEAIIMAWRSITPDSLLEYIRDIRGHSLNREFHSFTKEDLLSPNAKQMALARHVTVGMKPKKVHEVENFARYVDDLTSDIAKNSGAEITHIVDFGSGQNYLGRALASKPYSKHVIAIESKKLNIDGARGMDISAKLTRRRRSRGTRENFDLCRQGKMPVQSTLTRRCQRPRRAGCAAGKWKQWRTSIAEAELLYIPLTKEREVFSTLSMRYRMVTLLL